MDGVNPFVRHMLLCEDVRVEPSNPNKVDVLGMVSTIRPEAGSAFPLCHPVLCIYLELTGGRGAGEARIDVRQADSGQVIFSSPAHTLAFPPDPLLVRGVVFRILDGVFPQPGLYWVQFRYNENTLAEQPLLVRES